MIAVGSAHELRLFKKGLEGFNFCNEVEKMFN